MFRQSHYRSLRMVTLIVLVSQLLACKVDNNNNDEGGSDNLTANSVVDVNLNGSVGDGPIIGATVKIISDRGYELSSTESNASASYTLSTKAKGYDYPLLLQVSGGDDLVTGDGPDFPLLSVSLNPSEKSVNINPLSTLVVKMAQAMTGGISAANISAAVAVVSDSFAFGLDPSVIGNPISTQITDSNVANIVKASEALGEMVRRTRDSLLAAGTQVSGDEIMTSVAADLTDGVFDGAGADGVRPVISAVAKVVSAQVLVEALGNNLKVGGVVATEVIDQAIRITHPGISASQLSGSVRITSGMLAQTHIALAAAEVLDSSPAVQNIMSSVDGVTPNALPTDLVASLPSDVSAGLDQAVTLVAFAGDDKIAAINQTVTFSEGGSTTTDGTTGGGTTSGGTTDTGTTDSGSGSTTTDSTTGGGATSGGTTDTGTSGSGTGGTTTDGTTGGGTTSGGATDTGTTDSGSGSTTTGGTTSGGTTDTGTTDSGSGSTTTDGTTPIQTGTINLQWTAPVTRADGTPLSLADIDGYHIYYGLSAEDYSNRLDVTDGSAQSTTITDLPVGTYYIVMTTYDIDGRESAYSTMATKTTP